MGLARRTVRLGEHKLFNPFGELRSGFPDVQVSPDLKQISQGFRKLLILIVFLFRDEFIIHLPIGISRRNTHFLQNLLKIVKAGREKV